MRTPRPRKVIKAAQAQKDRDKKVNATFRFTGSVLERFKAKCRTEGLTMTAVLEAFMRDCTGNKGNS